MEDAWDWVEEELKKIQQDMPADGSMMQIVDAISVADFWKRRYDEELMLWERKLEVKEDEKKSLQQRAQAHETSIKEMEWKLSELERRWEQEKLLLEDRLKAKEVQAELEKTKLQWESRLKALEEENRNLKTNFIARAEGGFAPLAAAFPAAPADASSVVPVSPPSLAPSPAAPLSHELETLRRQMEKQLKEREENLRRSEDEVRRTLEKLENEKREVAQALAEREKELHEEKEKWKNVDQEVVGVSTQMTQRLASLREREKEHFIILEDLARGFAHRVRNYLGIMSGTIQLCTSSYKMEPELAEQLKVVDQNVQDMLKSIEDFLALARIPEMDPQPFNLNQMLDALTQSVAGNITLNKRYDSRLPAIKVDEKLFNEALRHLIENAVEAMPQGGELTLATAYDPARDLLSLKITDNGVGIGENHVKKVFQPYFSSKKNHKGLGLTVAKRVIDLHQGTLTLESARGKGTTVNVNLFPEPTAA